jgi:hypothetical protein
MSIQLVGQRQIGPDSVFYVYNSPFFKELLSKPTRSFTFEAGTLSLISSFDPSVFKMNSGEFIKVKDALYFHFHNSGRLFKYNPNSALTDSLKFVRLDATVNANYNIGSFVFQVGQDIYEYGGYGFWKSNGIVRRYNFKDREWDVVVLDQEIFAPASISSGYSIWVDSSEKYLYIPYQRIINDGISRVNEGHSNLLTSYRLNLRTFQWEYLGKLSQEAFELVRAPYRAFATPKGLFAAFTSRLYWIDFETNSIKMLADPILSQTLQRIQPYMLWYWDQDKIYWINPASGRYDSLFMDTSKFKIHSNQIWRKPVELSEYLLLLLLLIILFVVTYSLYKKKRKLLASNISKEMEESKHPFVATEISLLDLLMAKQLQGLTVTIPEINYVLGLKDKNQGMQKKVRSDIINRINEKYSFLSQEKVSLVQNIRSETDKRFFEYHLNPEHLERLRALLS